MRKSCLCIALIFGFTFAAAQWQSLNPGAGGQVQDIAAASSDKNILYLAADMEGVYRTSDNANSWVLINEGLVHNRIYSPSVDYKDSERIFAGTLYGLHYSLNGGKNWNFVN